MKEHRPNYIFLLFFFLLLPPLIYRILENPNGEFASMLLTLMGVSIIIASLIFIARNFKSVKFEENHIIFNYILTGIRTTIEYSQIRGIVYNFNYDNKRKYKWKEIELKTLTGKTYGFRKTFFMDFLNLENDLTNRFIVIKKSTQSAMSSSELSDFQRENKYFDIAKSKQDIRISIVLFILFVSLSALIFKSEPLNIDEKEVQAAFYFIILGTFFIYRAIQNLNFLKRYKKVGNNK